MKKFIGRLILICLLIASISGVVCMTINNHVINSTKENILISDRGDEAYDENALEEMKKLNADCIIVLGAGIRDRETPTPMLKDRLDTGIKLYREGVAPKILLTGDNGSMEHNEIHVMLSYVKKAGVPEEDIFCDHAGFSTFDSMYRADSIFQVKKAVIVTQTYHEYRSLYIADKLGISALGAGSDQKKYSGQYMREIREVAARVKDFLKCHTDAESLIGGEIIPITEEGIISHGE